MKTNRRRTIKAKIMLQVSVMMLIALLLTSSVSAFLNYNSTMQLLEQTMTETALLASERIQ